mmetsp:Transcript_50133/g.129031  ORF Transcript_50133/g.129031 Transcript_50133/m.129031 type:complete len:204 (+) Transcript_50133:135-746(+)
MIFTTPVMGADNTMPGTPHTLDQIKKERSKEMGLKSIALPTTFGSTILLIIRWKRRGRITPIHPYTVLIDSSSTMRGRGRRAAMVGPSAGMKLRKNAAMPNVKDASSLIISITIHWKRPERRERRVFRSMYSCMRLSISTCTLVLFFSLFCATAMHTARRKTNSTSFTVLTMDTPTLSVTSVTDARGSSVFVMASPSIPILNV